MSHGDSEAGSASLRGRGKLGRQFQHGDVRSLGHLRQKKGSMRLKLGVTSPAERLRREAPSGTNCCHQVDNKGERHLEMRRSGASRMTGLDKTDNVLMQT